MAGQPGPPPGHVPGYPPPEIRPYDQGLLTIGSLNKDGWKMIFPLDLCDFSVNRSPSSWVLEASKAFEPLSRWRIKVSY